MAYIRLSEKHDLLKEYQRPRGALERTGEGEKNNPISKFMNIISPHIVCIQQTDVILALTRS